MSLKKRWMKLIVVVMFCAVLLASLNSAVAQASDAITSEQFNGEAVILIDAVTKQTLFAKQAHERRFPASLTKIVTAIYVIEHFDLSEVVTVSANARNEVGTRVYLAEGEQVTLDKLIRGLLINSGNDAGTAIAEHIAGSNENFAKLVNPYLRNRIGVENTHFMNAHGLHDDEHYTTAYDMAMIASYAMNNELFREIVGTKQYAWEGKEWNTVLVNHNLMLLRYAGATGIKNGFTDQAKRTLAISAKRGESEFIAVTMGADSPELTYKDATELLDYAFTHYETQFIASAGDQYTVGTGKNKQTFTVVENLYVTLPLHQPFVVMINDDGKLIVDAQIGELFVSQLLTDKQIAAEATAAAEVQPAENTSASTGTKQAGQTAGEEESRGTSIWFEFMKWGALIAIFVCLMFLRRSKLRKARRRFSEN